MAQKSASAASISKVKRIAVLVMTYAAGPTMTCRVAPMAKRLRPMGIDLTIFALSESFLTVKETMIDGENVRLIGQAHFRKGSDGKKIRFGPSRYFREVLKTLQCFRTELNAGHFDLVQVFTTDPGALFIALSLRFSGYRVALDVDDSTYGMGVMAGYPKPILWVQWLLENYAPRFFQPLSGATFSRAKQYPGLTRLPIPISTEGYFRENPPCSQADITVIMVGNMAAPHLHLQVVDAIPKIIRENPKVRFCFVGTGERFQKIKERVNALGINSSVDLPGYLSREETVRRMCAADIGICPMSDNPFDRSRLPMKILEYMAAGLCIVSAPIGEVPNIIQHGKNGWFYRPDDMEDFAQAILTLASQPELVQRLSNQALQDARIYGPDLAEEIWYRFYEKAAQWDK